MTLTLYQSLQDIFGTWKGVGALLACGTVIYLFALAFQNYHQGDDENNSTF